MAKVAPSSGPTRIKVINIVYMQQCFLLFSLFPSSPLLLLCCCLPVIVTAMVLFSLTPSLIACTKLSFVLTLALLPLVPFLLLCALCVDLWALHVWACVALRARLQLNLSSTQSPPTSPEKTLSAVASRHQQRERETGTETMSCCAYKLVLVINGVYN